MQTIQNVRNAFIPNYIFYERIMSNFTSINMFLLDYHFFLKLISSSSIMIVN